MARLKKMPAKRGFTAPTASVALRTTSAQQHTLALDKPLTPPTWPLAPVPVKRLWFAIHLPCLPLEAGAPGDGARAVVEDQRGMTRVLLADAKAAAAGIAPGLSVNAALALLPSLQMETRSRLREQQALEQLAAWLEQFTSMVSIAGPAVLLLEVAGSLRLFAGLQNLRKQLAEGLRQQGFSPQLAIAPTPLAATWLAQNGGRICIREPANLANALRRLPLTCLDWPPGVCESLRGMGVTHIGDCLRLPREGFVKRFGAQRLLDLDRAYGYLPDPRSAWRAPETFCTEHELDAEQSDSKQLLQVCFELLCMQERFLRQRQLGTQSIHVSFFHLRAAATEIELGCAQAAYAAEHWQTLLRIRFERLILTEPVMAVRLQSGHTQVLQTKTASLVFEHNSARCEPQYSMRQLVERFIARIGAQAVQSLMLAADHRPQHAWCLRAGLYDLSTATQSMCVAGISRPLWMLDEPARLTAEQGYPLHQGRLSLLEGPERLETGWWDEDSIARDYYLAVNPRGVHLWVFRKRVRVTDWYLHGLFG